MSIKNAIQSQTPPTMLHESQRWTRSLDNQDPGSDASEPLKKSQTISSQQQRAPSSSMWPLKAHHGQTLTLRPPKYFLRFPPSILIAIKVRAPADDVIKEGRTVQNIFECQVTEHESSLYPFCTACSTLSSSEIAG